MDPLLIEEDPFLFCLMLTDQEVSTRLEALVPGVIVHNVQVLDGGISASSWLANVSLDGESLKWVVRLPGDYRYSERPDPSNREFSVLSSLQKGLRIVQKAIAVEPDESVENRRFFVMEYVEGSPLLCPKNADDFLGQYATALANVHATPFPEVTLETMEIGYESEYSALNHDLHEDQIREVLLGLRRANCNPKVLCHGDPWPGNMIWRDGIFQCFIDWEETRIADPLFDVSICRLELVWLLGKEAMDVWTRKYQRESRTRLEDLAYWDLCATLRPIRSVEQWAPAFTKLGRPDINAHSMTAGLKWFIEDALGRSTGSKLSVGQ